jgi:HlyD family secretion protein
MARRARVMMIVLPLLAAGALGLAVNSIARSNAAPDQSAPAIPAPGTEATVVAGSGVVEPSGGEVAVATPIPGVVASVSVRPGDKVVAGDPLFAIDDRIARTGLVQRQADLASAQARLRQTAAQLPLRRADADAARSALLGAEADRDEARDLVVAGEQLGGTITPRELARRRNALRVAEGRVGEAAARLDGALAALALVDPEQAGISYAVDLAAVEQAKAAVAQAQAELDRLVVRAPQDGTVLSVEVRPGEFATQGALTPPVTMGLLTPLQVRVDVDEADLTRLILGTPATASRRGAPGESIPLTFVRAEPLLSAKRSLSGAGDERVDTRVLQLIFEVDANAGVELRPGQLLDVTIRAAGPAPQPVG